MNQPRSLTMTPLEWGLLVVLSVLWGGSFLFVGLAVSEFEPLSIAVGRSLLAAVVLWLFVLSRRVDMPAEPAMWAAFVAMGALNSAVPFFLIAWGQSHIASGLASILIAMTPVFAVIVAHFATVDEKMTLARLGGVLISLLGVVVLIGPEALTGLGTDLVAQLAVLGAGLCYAVSGIFGRRFARRGVAPLAVATGQVSASSVLLAPVVVLVGQPWLLPVPGPVSWAALGALGVFSTALAYLIYFRVLATAGATNLLLVNFLVPITAIVLGAVVLGERLAGEDFLGMAIIAGGLALIDGSPLRKLQRLRRSRRPA